MTAAGESNDDPGTSDTGPDDRSEPDDHETYRMVFEASDPLHVVEALETIANIDGGPNVREVRARGGESASVPLKELTAKQRESIALAVDAGYYDTPRRASLDDLCEELEISKSAASQRLRKAESTIVKRVAEEIDPGTADLRKS